MNDNMVKVALIPVGMKIFSNRPTSLDEILTTSRIAVDMSLQRMAFRDRGTVAATCGVWPGRKMTQDELLREFSKCVCEMWG